MIWTNFGLRRLLASIYHSHVTRPCSPAFSHGIGSSPEQAQPGDAAVKQRLPDHAEHLRTTHKHSRSHPAYKLTEVVAVD